MTKDNLTTAESYFKTIDSFYPGLITLRSEGGVNQLYMSDQSIITDALVYNYKTASNTITLGGINFAIVLYFNFRNGDTGFLAMHQDLKLSDDTCIGLYKYNISIMYFDESSKKNFLYDKQAIMRRYTIDNIINDIENA